MSRRLPMDGAAITALREAQGLSIEAAAEYLELEPHVLSGLEKGHRTMTVMQARHLANRLELMEAASKVTAVPAAVEESA